LLATFTANPVAKESLGAGQPIVRKFGQGDGIAGVVHLGFHMAVIPCFDEAIPGSSGELFYLEGASFGAVY
jgi:hypothetical protein